MNIVQGDALNYLSNFLESHILALSPHSGDDILTSYLSNGFQIVSGPHTKTLFPYHVVKHVYVVAKPDAINHAVNQVGLEAFQAFFANLNLD